MTLLQKRVAAMLAAVAIVAAACALYREIPPEPVNCAICGEGRMVVGNAPFLLELSSGKSCELRIYERVPYNLYDLAAEQRDGYFYLLRCGKAEGYVNGGHDCHVTLPSASRPIDKSLYCIEHEFGGAYQSVRYAERIGKKVVNIAYQEKDERG